MNPIKYLRYLVWIVSLTIIPYAMHATNNAPITTAATVTACPGATFTVPITVTNFSNIESITLRIDFDSTVMVYYPALTTWNPAFSGVQIAKNPGVGGSSCWIGITWANFPPVNLSDGSTLFTLGFTYIGGTGTLHFNDLDAPTCEYADQTLMPMNDSPTSTYYHDGQVSTAALGGSVTGGSTIYFNNSTGNLTLGGYLGSVLKWQKQYNNGGYTDIPSTAGLTVYSETPIYTGTWDYRAVVQNSPCSAVNSSSTTVTVLTPVGTSKTWTGTGGTDWIGPTNWSPPGTPVITDDVIIPSNASNMPVILSTPVGCNNLFIAHGAALTVNPAKNLNVAGTLTIEGP